MRESVRNRLWKRLAVMFLAVMLMAGSLVTASAFAAAPFPFEEITVDELLKGYASGDFTAEEVVRAYLERIAKYESKYNAFTVLNPNVLEEAREDAAIMLDVIAGYTPEDPKTVASIGNIPAGGYTSGLNVQALRGKRIGLFGPGWRDVELTAETQKLYDQAIKDLEAQGAIVVPDPFAGSGFAEAVKEYGSIGVESVIYDMQAYLERLGPDSPIKSVEELLEKTGQKPSIFNRYGDDLPDPNGTPDLSRFLEARTRLLEIFNRVMDKHGLDALFFPQMYKETPLLDSDENIGATTVSEINVAGLPLVTVPGGYYESGAPFSVVFVGKMWSEAQLLGFAYDYEQATKHRKAPVLEE